MFDRNVGGSVMRSIGGHGKQEKWEEFVHIFLNRMSNIKITKQVDQLINCSDLLNKFDFLRLVTRVARTFEKLNIIMPVEHNDILMEID